MKPQSPLIPENSNIPWPTHAFGLATEFASYVTTLETEVEQSVARRRVLFVDDEPHVLEGLKAVLRKETYEIMTASSAQEALRILAKYPVDLVVSDECMPNMSGSEFLCLVRRLHPETVRIILTGHASVQAMTRAINDGEIYRFLTKPCHPGELAGTIRDALLIKEFKLQGARLIAANRRNRAVLESLEQHHPGITHVERTEDGCVVLEPGGEDLPAIIERMKKETADSAPSQREPVAPTDVYCIDEEDA